jgi:hypothetical protein
MVYLSTALLHPHPLLLRVYEGHHEALTQRLVCSELRLLIGQCGRLANMGFSLEKFEFDWTAIRIDY